MTGSKTKAEIITLHIKWESLDTLKNPDEARSLCRPMVCESRAQLADNIAQLQAKMLELEDRAGGVSRSVIEVRITAPGLVDLTLIDLPGLVNVAGKGEDKDIGRKIDALVAEYLKNEMCIILCTMPANIDYHNSLILQRAQEFDHKLERILPVVTKADCVECGAEGSVIKLVAGEATDLHFPLGFHIVKMRSSDDVKKHMSIEDALCNEKAYFASASSPYTDKIESSKCGILPLRDRLSRLYCEHLAINLPKVVADLESRGAKLQAKLTELGPRLSTPGDRRARWQQIKDDIEGKVNGVLNGRALLVEPVKNHTGTPLKTIRAALEHWKEEFGRNIVPNHYGDLCVGTELRFMEDCAEQQGVVVHVLNKVGAKSLFALAIKDSKEDKGWKYLTTACNTARDLFIGNGLSKSTSAPGGGWGSTSAHVTTAGGNPATTQGSFEEVKTNDETTNWEEIVDKVGSGHLKIDPRSGCAYTQHIQELDVLWYKLLYYPEHKLHPVYTSLVEQMRAERSCAMSIFEGEHIFRKHVHTWISTRVVAACKELQTSIAAALRAFLDKTVVAVYDRTPKVRTAIAVLCEQAHEQWVDNILGVHLNKLLHDDALNPQTQNNYFSSTVISMRNKPLKDMILSKEKIVNDEAIVPVSVIEQIFERSDHRPPIEFVAEEVAVYLRAYFKVACKTLVENVDKIVDASHIFFV